MKIKMFMAGLLLAGASTAAGAQATNTANGNVAIGGHVDSLCVLGAPSQASIDLGMLAATSGGRTGRLATIPAQQVTLPASFCNFAGTQLKVSASALLASDTSAVQDGFARAVNFQSTVNNWATAPATVTTAATRGGGTPGAEATGGTQPAPKQADLQLNLTNFTVPSDSLLVAGAYNGSVTITLGPSS